MYLYKCSQQVGGNTDEKSCRTRCEGESFVENEKAQTINVI